MRIGLTGLIGFYFDHTKIQYVSMLCFIYYTILHYIISLTGCFIAHEQQFGKLLT